MWTRHLVAGITGGMPALQSKVLSTPLQSEANDNRFSRLPDSDDPFSRKWRAKSRTYGVCIWSRYREIKNFFVAREPWVYKGPSG